MDPQKTAGWIATMISAVVVAYVLLISQRGGPVVGRVGEPGSPVGAPPTAPPVRPAPATKGLVVRNLPLE